MEAVPAPRLIISENADPFWNMALDEVLLSSAHEGLTLRLYSWNRPTLTLGYFQKSGEFDLDRMEADGFAVTRRMTGGGAILHDKELTYSVHLPLRFAELPEDVMDSYLYLLKPIRESLGGFGVESQLGCRDEATDRESICFSRKHCTDLLVDGKKLVGSAQRRTKNRLAQHGSILLEPHAIMPETAWLNQRAERVVTFSELSDQLVARFSELFKAELIPSQPTEEEEAQAAQLACSKYSSADWILKR